MSVLEGRVVAIAGAGGALGPSAVRAFEEAGARVSAPAREEVDLLDPAAVERWAATVAGEEARVDALIHMVGGWRGGTPVGAIPADDVRWLEDRLLRTVQLVTAALRSLMTLTRSTFAVTSPARASVHASAAALAAA